MVKNDQVIPSDSLQLEYVTLKSQGIQVSKATDYTSNTGQQCVESVAPTLNNNVTNNNNVFNIQLNYNINQALDPESWDSNFQAILLYESIEHLTSDIKNIKESLGRIQKYIISKAIKDNKANSIKDLEDVSKVAQGFILFLYKAYWDSLIVNNINMSFRNKVK